MIDVYCGGLKCPICNNEVQVIFANNNSVRTCYCFNKCYMISHFITTGGARPIKNVHIFKELLNGAEFKYNYEFKRLIEDRVKYWKEDYRYIAEILGGGDDEN